MSDALRYYGASVPPALRLIGALPPAFERALKGSAHRLTSQCNACKISFGVRSSPDVRGCDFARRLPGNFRFISGKGNLRATWCWWMGANKVRVERGP